MLVGVFRLSSSYSERNFGLSPCSWGCSAGRDGVMKDCTYVVPMLMGVFRQSGYRR